MSDLSKVASFLEVDEERISGVASDILSKLHKKLTDFNDLKSKNLKISAMLDHAKSQSNTNHELLKNETERRENEKTEFERQIRTLVEEKSKLSRRLIETENKCEDVTQQKELLEASKQDIVKLLDEKIADLKSCRDELEELLANNKQLRQKSFDLETQLQSKKSDQLYQQSESQRLSQEVALLKSNNEWLSSELHSKNTQYHESLKALKNDLENAEIKVAQTDTELKLCETTNKHLRDSVSSLQNQLQEKLTDLKKVSDEFNFEKQEFTREMGLKQRMVEALEKHVESLKQQMEETKKSLSFPTLGDQERKDLLDKLSDANNRLATSESHCEKLQETINYLTSDIKRETLSMDSLPSTKSSPTLPKLYADIGTLKKEVVKERLQKEELKTQLEIFISELESKVPILNSFRERTEILESELNDVTLLLESTSKERDEKTLQLQNNNLKLRNYEKQISSLTMQRTDLARQLQYILVQQSARDDMTGPLSTQELDFIKRLLNSDDRGNLSDTQSIITERLVVFKSAVELQQKNSELLTTIRNLADELERAEKENKDKAQMLQKSMITEAKDTILALRDRAATLEKELSVVKKERDAYKILTQGKHQDIGTPNLSNRILDEENKIKDLESKLAMVIKEAEANSQTWSEENLSLKSKVYEMSSKFESEMTSRKLAEDRVKLLQSTSELCRKDCEELKKRASKLQDLLLEQSDKAQLTMETLLKTKSDFSSLQSEFNTMKAERDFFKKVKSELKMENEQLHKTNGDSRVLVAQLQALQRERDQLLEETQKSFQEKISKLESNLSSLQNKLKEKSILIEESSNNQSSQFKWFQEKIDTLNEQLKSSSIKIEDTEQEIENLKIQLKEKTMELNDAEQRASFFITFANTSDSKELIDKLRTELESTISRLNEAYSQVKYFKNLAESSRSSIAELSEAFEKAQQESQNNIHSLQMDRTKLEHSITDLSNKITVLEQEKQDIKTQNAKRESDMQREFHEIEVAKKSVETLNKEYKTTVDSLKADLEAQVKRANEAQESYEQELQKHAEVSKALGILKSNIESYESKLEKVTAESATTAMQLKQGEELWQNQKDEYEKKIVSFTQRVEDLITQNRLLYDQIELLNKGTPEDSKSNSNNLLIALRRERDVLETKLEVSQSEHKILRQRLEIAKSDLQSAAMELSKVKNVSLQNSKLMEEHKEIMEQLNQISVLKESNTTLRNDAKYYQEECNRIKAELDEFKNKVEPLEASIASLKGTLKVNEQSLKLCKEEAERWKKRSQDILQKYEKADPEEHKKLVESVDILKKELSDASSAVEKAKEERDEWESKFQRIRNQARDRLNSSKEREVTLNNEIADLKESKAKVESSLQSAKNTISELEEKIDVLTEKFQTENDNLLKSINSSDDSREKISSLENLVNSLEHELSETKKKLLETSAPVLANSTAKIVENLKNEFESEKEELIRKKEAELRVRFEKEREESWRERELALQQQMEAKESEWKAKMDQMASSHDGLKTLPEENLEAIKKEWEKKYEEETQQRIKDAEEALKKRIRLPTQQKLEKIVEARKAVLEEAFEERVNAKVREALKMRTDQISLEKHEKEIEELRVSLQKQFDSNLADIKQKAFEEGRQQASLKLKFLETKIRNLEKEKNPEQSAQSPTQPQSKSQFPPFGFGSQQPFASTFSQLAASQMPPKRELGEISSNDGSPEKKIKNETPSTNSNHSESENS